MNNHFEIDGDTTTIYIQRRDSSIYHCLIDTEDLYRLLDFGYTWSVRLDRKNSRFYVRTETYGEKKTTVSLHRFLLEVTDSSLQVDHINGNSLDNRKSNLRVVSNAENQQNRSKGAQSNSKSGVRGVSWHKASKKWCAQIKVDGKTIWLGVHKTIEEAEQVVKEARREYMPFSEE